MALPPASHSRPAGPSAPLGRPAIPWLEIGPLLIFFLAFQHIHRTRPDEALLLAAGVFAGAAAVAFLIALWVERRLPRLLLASTAAIVGSAALAVLFDDPVYFLMRPTVINGGMAGLLLGGLLLRRNAARRLLGHALALPDPVWTRLALHFGLFFLAIAVANEWVWRTQSQAVWVAAKTFVYTPLTVAILALHLPFVRRHAARTG